jgi:polysaccharide deacetylase 2 family uncharacterized protein YibQ
MKTGPAVKIFLVFLSIFLILLGTRFVLMPHAQRLWPSRHGTPTAAAGEEIRRTPLEANIVRILRTLEVNAADIRMLPPQKDSVRRIEARIPKGHPVELIAWQLSQSVNGTPYRLADCRWDAPKKTCVFLFQSQNRGQPRLTLTCTEGDRFFSTTAKMAILIDNFAFEADQTTTAILSFPDPLTISLMPWDTKSSWTAQAAANYNKEIIIQLPLEPLIKVDSLQAKSMIFVHFPEDKIRGMVAEAMKIIPNFAGFNNMYGSRACEDSRVMKIILNEVGKRHGYFIETPTARNSVVAVEAGASAVPYGIVAASIDITANAAEIEDRLRHYCVVAQNKGSMLVSVKACPAFISALTNVRSLLAQNGVRLVYVSEIVSQTAEK